MRHNYVRTYALLQLFKWYLNEENITEVRLNWSSLLLYTKIHFIIICFLQKKIENRLLNHWVVGKSIHTYTYSYAEVFLLLAQSAQLLKKP